MLLSHLHLHVISSDLVSPYLKHKQHYNSFRPDSGFFIHLHEVITWLADDSSQAYLQTQLGVSSAVILSELTIDIVTRP